ncbi:MAG: cyclic nucleotide-binding domain-containing protein, partial [Gammaproteobacteria bacterium]
MQTGTNPVAYEASIAPLARLPATLRMQAFALATERDYGAGETIYQQGEDGSCVHYLLDGAVELLVQGRVTRTLQATRHGAQAPIDPPGRKRHSARAAGHARVMTFPRAALAHLLEQHEADTGDGELLVRDVTGSGADSATTTSDWMTRLLQSPLFATLPPENIQGIFARMTAHAMAADEVVIEQGSDGDRYYVIAQGYCEVSRTIAGGRSNVHLADLGPGAGFGEEALIAARPRNATVTMLTDGLLMSLARADFLRLVCEPAVQRITLAAALDVIAGGALWLDVRDPEEHDARCIAGSHNIALHLLRLHGSRLRRERGYVVCGDDRDHAAAGAFLLVERGFDAVCLDVGVRAAIAENPTLDSLLGD